MPFGPLRRLGLAPLGLLVSSLGLLVSSLGLAPLGLLASSLGMASLGLRINHLLCCHPSLGEVAGTVAFRPPVEGARNPFGSISGEIRRNEERRSPQRNASAPARTLSATANTPHLKTFSPDRDLARLGVLGLGQG